MRRRTQSPGPRQRLEPPQVFVEAQVEIDALHLAVGDPIEAGPQLVVDGQPHGVANGLVAIGRAEELGMRLHVGDELLEPAGKRPAPDHRGGDQYVGHGVRSL